MEEATLAYNWIDITVLLVVLFCMLMGLLSGMVMQIASIVGVVAGIALSALFSQTVADVISPRWISNMSVAHLVASMGCFFVGAGVIRLIAAFFSNLLKKLSLEKFDKFMGMVFGSVKGVIICSVVLLIAGRCGVDSVKQPVSESLSGGLLVAVADELVATFSDNPAVDMVKKAVKEKAGAVAEEIKKRREAEMEAAAMGEESSDKEEK